MPQVTIYLPEPLLEAVKKSAEAAGQSLSAFITNLARQAVEPATWPESFVQLYGACEGTLPEVDDLEAESVEPLL